MAVGDRRVRTKLLEHVGPSLNLDLIGNALALVGKRDVGRSFVCRVKRRRDALVLKVRCFDRPVVGVRIVNGQNETGRLELFVLEVGRLRIGGIHREGVHLRKVDRQRAGSGVDAARRILIALFRGRGRVGIRAVLEELIAAVRFRNCITSCVLDRYSRSCGALRDREADPRSIVLVQRDGNLRKRRAVVRLLLGNCERIAVLCLVARAGDRVGIRARRERDRLLRARAGIGRLAALQDGERRRRRGNMEGLRSGRNFPCKRGIAARLRHEAVAEQRCKVRRLHFRVGLEGRLIIQRYFCCQFRRRAFQRIAVDRTATPHLIAVRDRAYRATLRERTNRIAVCNADAISDPTDNTGHIVAGSRNASCVVAVLNRMCAAGQVAGNTADVSFSGYAAGVRAVQNLK